MVYEDNYFFHQIIPLGQFCLVVAMSTRMYVHTSVHLNFSNFFYRFFHQEIAGYGPLQSSDQWDRVLMAIRSKLRQKEIADYGPYQSFWSMRGGQNSEKVHNLQSPDEEKNIGATIRIGRKILCLPYAEFSNSRHLGRFFHRVAMSVCLFIYIYICPLFMLFFLGLSLALR